MWEAVADESKLAFLDVLLDGVEEFVLGDLSQVSNEDTFESTLTHLLLSVRPSWNLDHHVQDRLLLIGIQRDVMERRDRLAILLDVAAVVESVWLPQCTRGILRRCLAVRV